MSDEEGTTGPKWPLEKQIEFHLKEFEFLKSEIARLDSAKRALQVYTVGGVAAITAWLATNRDTVELLEARIAWWLPFFVVIMGAMISRTYVRSAMEIGTYIGRLERLSAHADLGWEASIAARRRMRGGLTTRREATVWAIVLVMSLAAGVAFGIPKQALQMIKGMHLWP